MATKNFIMKFFLVAECWECGAKTREIVDANFRKAANAGIINPACRQCKSTNIDWEINHKRYGGKFIAKIEGVRS